MNSKVCEVTYILGEDLSTILGNFQSVVTEKFDDLKNTIKEE